MTWITDNKGAGPWDFVPQPEKCGYVNNPRWTANRASDIDHEPCGYWPKSNRTGRSLFSCGDNTYGNLGLGDQTDRHTLTWVMDDVQQVGVGGSGFTGLIKTDGSLWACGINFYGNLGLGWSGGWYDTWPTFFTRVGNRNDWVKVTCTHENMHVLRADGTIWSAGLNAGGEHGTGNKTQSSVLVQAVGMNNVVDIASPESFSHVLALKADGTMWVTGTNTYGEHGLGTTGASISTYVQTGVGSVWKAIGAGGHSSRAIKNDGTLWGTGYNHVMGELGTNDRVDKLTWTQEYLGATDWASAHGGVSWTVARRTNGRIFGAGEAGGTFSGPFPPAGPANTSFLGLGPTITATLIHLEVTSAAGAGAPSGPWNVWKTGQSGMHSVAVNRNGTLWTTGVGDNGRLGYGFFYEDIPGVDGVDILTQVKRPLTNFTDESRWVDAEVSSLATFAIAETPNSGGTPRCGTSPVWPMPA